MSAHPIGVRRLLAGRFSRPLGLTVLASIASIVAWQGLLRAQTTPAAGQYPQLPSETPATFEVRTDSFDHTRREVMIPMRDGVKLHTVILVPKGARRAPMLLTRTPNDANAITSHAQSVHLGPNLTGYDNATDVIVDGGYIRVVQVGFWRKVLEPAADAEPPSRPNDAPASKSLVS